ATVGDEGSDRVPAVVAVLDAQIVAPNYRDRAAEQRPVEEAGRGHRVPVRGHAPGPVSRRRRRELRHDPQVVVAQQVVLAGPGTSARGRLGWVRTVPTLPIRP